MAGKARQTPTPSPSPGTKPVPVAKGLPSIPFLSKTKTTNTVPKMLQPPKKPSPDRPERMANTANKMSAAELAKAKAADAALKKLTGGQKLTDAEKKILNIKTTKPNSNKNNNKNNNKNKNKNGNTNSKSKNTGSSSTTNTGTNTDTNTDESSQEDPVVNSTPDAPESGVTGESETPKTYKPATPDLIILQEEAFPAEVMTDLLFEDIGGTEILNLARHDLVSGIDIKYQQISNLAKIETIYGGANLIALQSTSEQVFKKYPLSRYTFVPETTADPSGFNSPVYLDIDGNLIVELANLDNSYQIEIEFQSADTNDIIY
jgi:hypothetical protein